MGKMGRPPKPADIKKLAGNPGNRPIVEGVKPDGDAHRPDHLDGYALDVWERIVNAMPPGLYKATDTEMLAAYCIAASKLRDATMALKVEGEVIQPGGETVDMDAGTVSTFVGKAYRNPWSAVAREATMVMVSVGARLGLDPVSRDTVKPPENKPASKFGALMGIPGGKVA